jgi:hypothetical protein
MILIDNVAYLKKKFSNIINFYESVEDQLQLEHLTVVTSKSGLPTLEITNDNSRSLLHSKYDPKEEASHWISEYESQINEYDHLFFYGVGFAYHVELLMERYPDKFYSLYEPDISILYKYLSTRSLSDLPLKQLKNFYVDYMPSFSAINISQFVESMQEKVLVITHPVYTRIYAEKVRGFEKQFKETIATRRSALNTNVAYEKLWTVNSLHNFYKVLETTNIFQSKQFFKGKPVIMVAAGPSLEDEIENLREIKEKGLAYIFTVGSANKALITQGIYPDAICTYDPNTYNHLAYEEIITNQIKEIPMIFGTSVGYKTVELYPGPMLYMVTNQDSVSQFYFQDQHLAENDQIVSDAPTIAIVTLQLLYKLGFSRIILVGQNFSYRNNQYYAKGIKYQYRQSEELSEAEKVNLIMTESVDGSEVPTVASHDMARKQMESIISNYKEQYDSEIYNTTQGGAKIEGAPFKSLVEITSEFLTESIVENEWYKGATPAYDTVQLLKQSKLMYEKYELFPKFYNDAIKQLKKMDTLVKARGALQLNKQFPKLDKIFKSMFKNEYYDVFIRPMCRNQLQYLNLASQEIRTEIDIYKKAEKTISSFTQFLANIQKLYTEIEFLFNSLTKIIEYTVQEKQEIDTTKGDEKLGTGTALEK